MIFASNRAFPSKARIIMLLLRMYTAIANARMRRHVTQYKHKVQPLGWTNDNGTFAPLLHSVFQGSMKDHSYCFCHSDSTLVVFYFIMFVTLSLFHPRVAEETLSVWSRTSLKASLYECVHCVTGFHSDAASHTGDSDSFWAPGLTFGFQGLMNFHRMLLILPK